MSHDDFQRKADRVRAIPLEVVLTSWAAVRDRSDKSRWHTSRGPLSVTGAKFYNWHTCQGGGGAIDLVMHLSGWNARQAIRWLDGQLDSCDTEPIASSTHCSLSSAASRSRRATRADKNRSTPLCLPTPSLTNLSRLRHYLTQKRAISATIVDSLIDEGRLYADQRGNVVFLMVAGKPNRPIGAELRGTGERIWRGLAPGSCKDTGYFWVGQQQVQHIVLCESAIDAMSCFQLHTQLPTPLIPGKCICISTAGVRSDAPWLRPLLARGYHLHCGFDSDEPGERASRQLIARHPSIQRLRPPAHDWNDALTARRS